MVRPAAAATRSTSRTSAGTCASRAASRSRSLGGSGPSGPLRCQAASSSSAKSGLPSLRLWMRSMSSSPGWLAQDGGARRRVDSASSGPSSIRSAARLRPSSASSVSTCVLVLDLLGPHRDDERGPLVLPQAVREEGEQLQAGAVDPLHVLDDEDRGLLGGDALGHAQEGLVEAQPLQLIVADVARPHRGHSVVAGQGDLGQEARQLGARRADDARETVPLAPVARGRAGAPRRAGRGCRCRAPGTRRAGTRSAPPVRSSASSMRRVLPMPASPLMTMGPARPSTSAARAAVDACRLRVAPDHHRTGRAACSEPPPCAR